MISSSPYVSLLVVSYNGLNFLREYLSSIVDAAEESSYKTEVVVADDGSGDGSISYLQNNWPDVRIVAIQNNSGHVFASNKGVAECKGEIVVVLDNDVKVDKGFVDPLISHFDDSKVFAVNSKIIVPRLGNINESVKLATFHHGMLYFTCIQDPPEHAIPILYATACSAAYRRSTYLCLGGFDSLYPPLYWDDTDLSYRARKRGYKVLYEPKSVVEHWYGGSTPPDKQRRMEIRKWENYFLFVWKNLTEPRLFSKHIGYLPLVLAKASVTGHTNRIAGFFAALKQLPKVRRARAIEKSCQVITDSEILREFTTLPADRLSPKQKERAE